MAQIADYAMIANSIKNDLQTPADNEQQQNTIANIAAQTQGQQLKNDAMKTDVDSNSSLKESVKKNAIYDPASGKVSIDHEGVVRDLTASGRSDLAHSYQVDQHAKDLEKLSNDNKFAVNSLAAAMLEPDINKKNQIWQYGIQHLKSQGHDMTGIPEQYDETVAKQMYGQALGAEQLAKQHIEEIKAQTAAAREDDYSRNVVSLANRRDAQNAHLTIGDSGNMDPEDVLFYGEQYAKGDTSVIKNMSKSDAAAVRSAARKSIVGEGGNSDTAISDRQDSAAVSKAVKDFSTGKQGNAVRSFNTALEHIHSLEGLVGALDNGDIQLVNKAKNAYASATGSAAPTNFDATKKIVADEIVKAIIGASGGVADREEAARVISSTNSPAQLQGVINSYKELMSGQLKGLEEQYAASTGRKDFADKYLTKKAKEVRAAQQGGSGEGSMTPGIAPQGVTVSNW